MTNFHLCPHVFFTMIEMSHPHRNSGKQNQLHYGQNHY